MDNPTHEYNESKEERYDQNQNRPSQMEVKEYEVREKPVFPGGDNELLKYLSRSVKYPVAAEEQGIQGTVTVKFVVEKDGRITNARIMKSVDPYLDKEALRVVRSMPRWTPASNQNGPIASEITVPVSFRLQ